jgi:hypothetical protein
MKIRRLLNIGTVATIFFTLVLFGAALAVKGFTHDILLEAGVFLISVKLVLTSYRSEIEMKAMRADLAAIRAVIEADSNVPEFATNAALRERRH